MDLEFEKYCKVDQSPRTVLPSSQHHAQDEKSSKKPKSSSRNIHLSLEEGFKEIRLRDYHRSASCKTPETRNADLPVDREVLKRGSVYQSSTARISFKRSDSVRGRKKIEFAVSGDASFSFSLLDSICGSDEEEEEEPSLEVNGSPKKSMAVNATCSVECSREQSSSEMVNRESSSSRPAERDFVANSKFKSHEVVGPSSSANMLMEDDNPAFQKSLSAKLALPHSPTHSDSDGSKGSPIRKMFDPLKNPKSHQSLAKLDNGVFRSFGRRKKTLRKSLLHDFSCAAPQMESRVRYVKKDQEDIVPPCSPAHLHDDLKLDHKHGVPYFELSLPHSDNVLVAKTWKAEDALNWVYTFHSTPGRKKNSVGGWGVKCGNKDSPMVAQMQVSCHLCSELKEGGTFSNSIMTEFLLYDIMHARNSLADEDLGSVPDVVDVQASNVGLASGGASGLDSILDPVKLKNRAANAFEPGSLNLSSPYPWAAADLHPSHEVASIAVQVPFEKRESLKHRSGDTFAGQVHSTLFDLSLTEQTPKGITDGTSSRVNVVIPLGHHSLPTSESRGPLPLLDRWRLGGGCDCGGWDMACPLVVFDNLSTQCKEDYSLLQSNQPFNLYLKGAKEQTPALTMRSTRKGRYSVDFHAQLSALQAFSICVAILHASEASPTVNQEKHKQLLQCSSTKALVEDKVKIFIEAITEEEEVKEREKVIKAAQDHPPSFVLNPPFSPIAGV